MRQRFEKTEIRALFKKKRRRRNSTPWVLMYSSAAKSCAYVAEATLWSPLYSTKCVHACVCVRGGQEQGRGGTGGRGRRQFLKRFWWLQGMEGGVWGRGGQGAAAAEVIQMFYTISQWHWTTFQAHPHPQKPCFPPSTHPRFVPLWGRRSYCCHKETFPLFVMWQCVSVYDWAGVSSGVQVCLVLKSICVINH